MKTGTLVPLSEYLATSYQPDVDFLEGRLMERNVGEYPHSDWQTEIAHYFRARKRQLGVIAFTELRIQVRPERFRIPDICCLTSKPDPPYVTAPPVLCIEILSKDDRMTDMEERVEDYLQFGVPYVWVINPENGQAWMYTSAGRTPANGVLRAGSIEVPISELFRDE